MRLWCPGAQRDYVANDNGGLMLGGPSRAVWHTTEGSTIAGALSVYRGKGFWPHITWDPRDGQIQQHLPADVAARALRPGSVPTNRLGVVCIQIEVVARAEVPFTSRLMHRFPELLAWLDSLGIPRTWPAGRPLAYGPDERRPGVVPAAYGENNGTRSARIWCRHGGHFGHSQIPGNHHWDPGAVDIGWWLQQEDHDMTPKQAAQLAEIARRVDWMDDRIKQSTVDVAWIKTALGQVRTELTALTAAVRPGIDPAALGAAAYEGARRELADAGLPSSESKAAVE